jgi:hypothetical protein
VRLRELWPRDRLGRWSAVATLVLLVLLLAGAVVRAVVIFA